MGPDGVFLCFGCFFLMVIHSLNPLLSPPSLSGSLPVSLSGSPPAQASVSHVQ